MPAFSGVGRGLLGGLPGAMTGTVPGAQPGIQTGVNIAASLLRKRKAKKVGDTPTDGVGQAPVPIATRGTFGRNSY